MTEVEVTKEVKELSQIDAPKMYKVILHNDNRTTFEFVIAILTQIFHKNAEQAEEITISIHEQGQGVAGGPYTKEIADEKTHETISIARANGFPLIATVDTL